MYRHRLLQIVGWRKVITYVWPLYLWVIHLVKWGIGLTLLKFMLHAITCLLLLVILVATLKLILVVWNRAWIDVPIFILVLEHLCWVSMLISNHLKIDVTMKSYIKNSLFAGLLLSTATACTNLDVDVKSTYTSYPESEIATEAKMADLYYGFRGALGRRFTEAAWLSSDEFMAVTYGGNWYDGGNYVHSSLHLSNTNDAHLDWAGDLTGAITKCNRAIIDLGGDKASEASIARALAMRAFYHFVFMDTFGDTPKLDHVLGESEAIDRSPRADIAAFIEDDLLRAIKSGGLAENVDASTYGKPTKWMAEALLVKLYLNWAVYTSSDVANYEPPQANAKL